MNDKQRIFAEHYAYNPNATEAAKAAGYSEKTARSQGQRLLTNADIQKYLSELQELESLKRIATLTDTKSFWTTVMNNKNEKTSDRLKASELLAKSAGAFANGLKITRTDDGEEITLCGDGEQTDVVIYMPQIESEEKNTWTEDDET